MIPSAWRERLDPPAAPYPNDGDDYLLFAFGDLIGSYYIESSVARGEFRAYRLYQDAVHLDRIRIAYARGIIDAETASIWFEAGTNHLRDSIVERIG